MAKAAAATKTEIAVAEEQNNDLIAADMMDELIADAGAGISTSADDNIVPFIVLLQDMSPEIKKRDPNYVEGAEAGMFMDRSSHKLWAGDAAMAERTGLPELQFQHCYFDHAIVEWVPRTDGGGFVARHSLQGATVDDTMHRLGARQIPDPQDPNKMNWKSADGTHDMIDTRYHFGNIVNDGTPKPAVIAFSSTGHTASRQWMTAMKDFKITDREGKIFTPPAWARKYTLGSKPRENKKGSFFVATVADGGWIREDALRAAGKELHDGAKAGTITASTNEAGTGEAGVSDEI